MNYKTLLFSKENGIGIVTINRPEVLNALNTEVFYDLYNLFHEIDGDPEVRVVILTGSGDKAFVAGADISELVALNPLFNLGILTMDHQTFLQLESMDKPSIAAVNGYALGEAAK